MILALSMKASPSIPRSQLVLIFIAPAVPALHYFNNVLGLNKSFVDDVTARADACGYLSFMQNYTTNFPPPKGPFAAPNASYACDVWTDIAKAIFLVNPCLNIYHLNGSSRFEVFSCVNSFRTMSLHIRFAWISQLGEWSKRLFQQK